MGGVPGLNRGHRGGQRERAVTLLTEAGAQPLRFGAGGQSQPAPLAESEERKSYLLGPRWADRAFKGQGQGGVWQATRKRFSRRPKASKIITMVVSLSLFLLFLKRSPGHLRNGSGPGGSECKTGRRGRRGRGRAAGRAGPREGEREGRTDSGPGPGPPPHSLALLAVIEHDGVVVAARDDRLAVGAKVKAVNLVRVLAEHLGDAETPQHAVGQLHGGGCWRRWRRRRAGAGPGSRRAGGLAAEGPTRAGRAPRRRRAGRRPTVGPPPPLPPPARAALFCRDCGISRTVPPHSRLKANRRGAGSLCPPSWDDRQKLRARSLTAAHAGKGGGAERQREKGRWGGDVSAAAEVWSGGVARGGDSLTGSRARGAGMSTAFPLVGRKAESARKPWAFVRDRRPLGAGTARVGYATGYAAWGWVSALTAGGLWLLVHHSASIVSVSGSGGFFVRFFELYYTIDCTHFKWFFFIWIYTLVTTAQNFLLRLL